MRARYRSRCAECPDMIETDEPIVVGSSGARHVTCPDDDPAGLGHARPPCPRCFLEPSASGECGCDE